MTAVDNYDKVIIVPVHNKSKVISLKIDEATLNILDILAWKFKMSRSELIRLLIKAFIYLMEKRIRLDDEGTVVAMSVYGDGSRDRVLVDLKNESVVVNI